MLSYEGGVDNVVLKEMAAKPQILQFNSHCRLPLFWRHFFHSLLFFKTNVLNTLQEGKGCHV